MAFPLGLTDDIIDLGINVTQTNEQPETKDQNPETAINPKNREFLDSLSDRKPHHSVNLFFQAHSEEFGIKKSTGKKWIYKDRIIPTKEIEFIESRFNTKDTRNISRQERRN